MSYRKITSSLLAATILAGAAPAFAQQASDSPEATANPADSGEIVVTAQKRSEVAQRVPISLLAFNEKDLATAGVTSPGDLQRIAPTFKFTTSIGTLAARLSVRGIGTFSNSAIEPSVATFINGIYIPRPAAIINSLLDVSAVEVLSGPQGTLFGRNASVGAISFRTTEPGDKLSVSLKSEYSTGNHSRTEGAIDLPLSDKIGVRVAGLADIFGGYWRDDLTGKRFGGLDTYQGRVTVKAALSDSITWLVRGDYQQNKGDGLLNAQLDPSSVTPTTLANITAFQGGIVPSQNTYSGHNNTFNGHAYVDDSIWGISSDLSISTGGDYTLRLLNGYYDWNSKQGDGDTASLSTYVLGRDLRYRSKSNSHELQIISPKNQLLDGKLDFVAGLYYFHEDLGIRADSLNGPSFCDSLVPVFNPGPLAGIPGATTADKIAQCKTYVGPSSIGDFNQSTRSIAGYGQFTFKLLPTLDVTGGIRYTDEKKSGSYVGTLVNPTGAFLAANETTALALSDSRFTWRANLAWRPQENLMLFATASTGFKSGGFNNGVASAVLGQDRVFQAETVTNYELGLKSQFLDRALTFNATAYRMDIGNFQERSIIGTTSSIRNVGRVRQQGVEAELVMRPTRNVRFNASIAYLDSKILSYCNAPRPAYLARINTPTPTANCPTLSPNTQDLSGSRLNYTPEWSGVFGIEFGGGIGTGGMRWAANSDINLTSSTLTGTVIDNSPITRQEGYALLNGRLTLFGDEDRWSLSVFGRNLTNKGYCVSKVIQVLDGQVGVRYDTDGLPGNDATGVRCNVGAPRVIGVAGSIKF